MRTSAKAFLLALAMGTLAWGSTQVYASWCTPSGFTGLLTSFLTMDSSPCRTVFSLISHTHTLYAGMMGTLLVSIVSAISEALQSEGVRPEVICSCPPGHSKSS